jgi:hypothetical protein
MRKAIAKVLLAVVCGIVAGCAATGGIPDGARAVGVYAGKLTGNVYDGPIEVELFETAAGETVFRGRFFDPVGSGWYYFRGTVEGKTLDGTISLGFGTIAGELAGNRQEMNGTFRLAQNHGSWQAVKQSKEK